MPDRTLADGVIRQITAADGTLIAIVGCDGVASIEVVDVHGQASMVPWFEVADDGGVVLRRVNAAHVGEVRYERPEEEGATDGYPF